MAATIILASTALSNTPAMTQPFEPVRKLTTWYTDRSLIDIEIVGSTSLQPDAHRPEPQRVLRFRLERAYVQTLLGQDGPGFDIVGLAFDMDSGLASSLLTAASMQGRHHESAAGVPELAHSDVLRRTLLISLRSDVSQAAVRQLSEKIRKCTDAAIGNELVEYKPEARSGCSATSSRRALQYLASYDDLLLRIVCRESRAESLGCKVPIPFEEFGVELTFHRDHLPKWRAVVDRATELLRSKQYR